MATVIDIHSESEGSGGWTFIVEVTPAGRSMRPSQLKLSFADYNLWCASGSSAPADVARAVVEFMLRHNELLPSTFEASLARRKFSDADAIIPQLIRG